MAEDLQDVVTTDAVVKYLCKEQQWMLKALQP